MRRLDSVFNCSAAEHNLSEMKTENFHQVIISTCYVLQQLFVIRMEMVFEFIRWNEKKPGCTDADLRGLPGNGRNGNVKQFLTNKPTGK